MRSQQKSDKHWGAEFTHDDSHGQQFFMTKSRTRGRFMPFHHVRNREETHWFWVLSSQILDMLKLGKTVRHHTQVYKVLLVKQVTSLSHHISQLALSVASAPRSQISQPRPWAHVQHFIFQVFAVRFLRPGTAGIDWPTSFRWSWRKSSKGPRVESHLDRFVL